MDNIINDILTDLVEGGGSHYWANFRNVKRDDDLNVISFEVKDDTEMPDWKIITAKEIEEAIEKMKNNYKELHIGVRIAEQFFGNREDWDYDATGIDCLLQIAAMQEVVYG